MKTRDSNQRCLASVPETIILNTVLATTYPNLSELHPVCACGLYSPFSSMDLQFPLKEQDLRNISKPPPKILTHSSVQFSLSVVSNSLRPHESQHARPPCPSPIPGVYSNSCLLSQWCHPAISSSVVPFSSCPQSLPASGSLPMSQFFTSGGQSTGVSASASVLPINKPGLISFRMDWLYLLAVQGTHSRHTVNICWINDWMEIDWGSMDPAFNSSWAQRKGTL